MMSASPLAQAIGLGLAMLLAAGRATAQDAPAPSVQVQTTALQKRTFEDAVKGFGSVVTSDELTADISFPHPGQITDLKVRPGQKVTKGEALLAITADPTTLEGFHKAVAALDFAERDLARVKTLLAQHLATNSQVAAAQKTVSDANADVEAQRKVGNDQPFRVATAPFDGFVAKVMNSPGDRIQANTVIMQLARTDQGMRVIVGLRPEDAARVQPGMPARVAPVLGADQKELGGIVRQVSGTLNPTSHLLEVWIDLPQQSEKLVPGTSAAVAIVISTHEAWVVPRSAVLSDAKGAYIFQIAGGKARRVEVKTGIENDQATEVSGSFDPSLKVVTSGNYELHNGAAAREAPASPQ